MMLLLLFGEEHNRVVLHRARNNCSDNEKDLQMLA